MCCRTSVAANGRQSGPKLGARNSGNSRTPQQQPPFLSLIVLPFLVQTIYKMARTRKTTRRNCRHADSSISLPSASPRETNTIVDIPRRVRLLCAADSTVGKLPRKKLFEAYGISKSTAYRIINSELARRSDSVYKRGRKPILASYERDAVEAIKNSCFCFITSFHYINISANSLASSFKRGI
jgi:hypothetical protein